MVTSELCRKLCQELARVGSFEQQAVAQQRLDEIEPAARFAEYQLRKKGQVTDTDVPPSPTTPHVKVSRCPLKILQDHFSVLISTICCDLIKPSYWCTTSTIPVINHIS